MAVATYKRGEIRTIKYTAGGTIVVDQILVLGAAASGVDGKKAWVGVAREAMASGDVGIVAVSGVWEFPKVSAAVIKAGESVGWDASAGEVDDNLMTSAAGDVNQFGCAMADAGNAVLFVDVDISEPGTYDGA
jgi:predicted RecA/RadA family phage recombinase